MFNFYFSLPKTFLEMKYAESYPVYSKACLIAEYTIHLLV